MVLLDSNIIIYASQPQHTGLRQRVAAHDVAVSVIAKIEVLGFTGLDADDARFFRTLFETVQVIGLDPAIVDRAIDLRQQRRMSLGDAVIAATALVHRAMLMTRNSDDFRWIDGLQLENPLASDSKD